MRISSQSTTWPSCLAQILGKMYHRKITNKVTYRVFNNLDYRLFDKVAYRVFDNVA